MDRVGDAEELRAVIGGAGGTGGSSAALDSEVDLLDSAGAVGLAARGGLIRSVAYFIGLLLTGISAALVFRHLGRDQSGVYVTGNTLVGILSTVSDLGLTAVGLKELSARPADQRPALARTLLGLRLTLTGVAGTLITLIAWVAYSGAMAAGVALLTIGVVMLVIQDNVALMLSLSLQNGRLALLEITRALITVLCMAALVLAGAGLVPFFAAGLPGFAIVLAMTVWMVGRRRVQLRPSFNLSRWMELVRPMIPFSAALAASALYLRAAQLIVSAICTRAQLGDYSLAFRIVEAAAPVPGLLISALLPVLSRAAANDGEVLDALISRMCEVCALIGGRVSVSVAVAAPLAVTILGGSQFHAAGTILALQGISLGAVFVSSIWGYGLFALGEYRTLLRISTLGLLTNVVVVIVFVEIFGVDGAAAGSSLVEVLYALVAGWSLRRLRPGVTLDVGRMLRIFITGLAALTPLALAPLGVPVIGRMLLSSAIYVAFGLLLRTVPTEILDFVRAKWTQPAARTG